MPPRYAYWTILIGDEPTAFRSGSQEDLMPTLKRLQQRHAEARMMWWQNGKLWASRLDAQEAMLARGEIGRRADPRQDDRRRPFRSTRDRPSERPPGQRERREERDPLGKLQWKPKGESTSGSRRAKPDRPEWKPKGSFTPERQKFAAEGRESRRSAKREGGPDWKPRPQGKLEWRPKQEGRKSADEGGGPRRSAKREGGWVPKADYKKSLGIEAKKDKNWRPGGEHKDPRQKYKDAKKAKWGRFKQTARKRWESKAKKNDK